MDAESKQLLQKTLELEEENNSMLRSMRRSQRISQFMSFIYWIFIIGSAIGAYYVIQPYIDQLKGIYTGANDVLKGYQN